MIQALLGLVFLFGLSHFAHGNITVASATIGLCGGANYVYVDPVTNIGYATCSNDNTIIRYRLFDNYNGKVVDGSFNTQVVANCTNGSEMVSDSNGNLYTACANQIILSAYNRAADTYTSSVIGTCATAASLAINTAGNKLIIYAACAGTNNIMAFTASNIQSTWTSSIIGTCNAANGVSLDNSGNVYAACPMDNAIFKFTISNNNAVQSLVGSCLSPQSVWVEPFGRDVYAACAQSFTNTGSSGNVVRFTVPSTGSTAAYSQSVISSCANANFVWGTTPFISLPARTGSRYVACAGSNSVIQIDAATDAVTTLTTNCQGANGVASDPNGQFIFAACQGSSTVMVITSFEPAVISLPNSNVVSGSPIQVTYSLPKIIPGAQIAICASSVSATANPLYNPVPLWPNAYPTFPNYCYAFLPLCGTVGCTSVPSSTSGSVTFSAQSLKWPQSSNGLSWNNNWPIDIGPMEVLLLDNNNRALSSPVQLNVTENLALLSAGRLTLDKTSYVADPNLIIYANFSKSTQLDYIFDAVGVFPLSYVLTDCTSTTFQPLIGVMTCGAYFSCAASILNGTLALPAGSLAPGSYYATFQDNGCNLYAPHVVFTVVAPTTPTTATPSNSPTVSTTTVISTTTQVPTTPPSSPSVLPTTGFPTSLPASTYSVSLVGTCLGANYVYADSTSVFATCNGNNSVVSYYPVVNTYSTQTVGSCPNGALMTEDKYGYLYASCSSTVSAFTRYFFPPPGIFNTLNHNFNCSFIQAVWLDSANKFLYSACTSSGTIYASHLSRQMGVDIVSTSIDSDIVIGSCNTVNSIWTDNNNNVFAACSGTNNIVGFHNNSNVFTPFQVGTCQNPLSIWGDAKNNIYAACAGDNAIEVFLYIGPQNYRLASKSVPCNAANQVLGDTVGNIYAACFGDNAITSFSIDSSGNISPSIQLAGPTTSLPCNGANSVWSSSDGQTIFAACQTDNTIIKITKNAVITTPPPQCPKSFPYLCTNNWGQTVCFNDQNAANQCNGPINSWCALPGAPAQITNFISNGYGILCSQAAVANCPPSFPFLCTAKWGSSVCFNKASSANACSGPINSWCVSGSSSSWPSDIAGFVSQGYGIACSAPAAQLCSSTFPYLCTGNYGSSVCYNTADAANACNGPIGSWCAIKSSSVTIPPLISGFLSQGYGSNC